MLCAVHHQKRGCDGARIILMCVAVKRLEIAQAISPRLAVFSDDGLEFDCNLDERRGCNPHAAILGWNRTSGARANRDIYHPVIVVDLLMVSQLSHNFTELCPFFELGTMLDEVGNDAFR